MTFPSALRAVFCGLLLGGLLLAGLAHAAPRADDGAPRFRVLVFTKTAGVRHASIKAGVRAIKQLGKAHDFDVDATEDAAAFTPSRLSRYDAVVFLNTSGDVLDAAQQAAFEAYVRGGGGFAGVHGAATTEYDWPWFGVLVGAYFADHPAPQAADVLVVDRQHPATRGLPARWRRSDEWYNFRTNPRGAVHVLAALDEKSYDGGTMGHDHPIAWAHVYDGGRAWYTGLGHAEESYADPLFLDHLLGGIAWAAGAADGDAGATLAASYDKVVLDEDVTDPMELSVASDGRVFFVERAGAVKVWEPQTGATRVVGYIPVYKVIEDGLLGLTLDPDFAENHWLYVFYAPEDAGPSRLSRFTLADGMLDLASEKVLLEVAVQREDCCHAGGSLAFDPQGNLYLSTGDNTDPYDREGSPLDERPGRANADAQRSSGNTNDLRGKILRIHPEPDGTYTLPDGNLFAGDAQHRPEIYTMGHRNPFRIAIDPKTGYLYWGDVGNGDPPNDRGGWGWDEFNEARRAGNFGWPYFTGPNQPYRDYDYATGVIGAFFDPDAPVNDSPNNTGARDLPPAQPALIWYTYGESEDFPEMGAGGINPMAGPRYRYDPETAAQRALPAYYDGALLIYEWMRNWVQEVRFDDDGALLKISPFLPGLDFVRPMDMELGPDGALYVLEWGDEFWGSNPDAQLVRLDYYGSAMRPPEAVLSAEPVAGPVPLRVHFDGKYSENRNGDEPLAYAWDFDGDGQIDARAPDTSFTYETPGNYTARLAVTDAHGGTATAEVTVSAGNTAPSLAIDWPLDGGFFDFDAPVDFKIRVMDAEDGAIDGGRVVVQPYTGFDTDAFPLAAEAGTEGTFQITPRYTHVPDLHFVDRYGVLEARYTDFGAPGVAPLEARARVKLQPRRKEAEHVAQRHGAVRRTHGMHPAAAQYEATALTVMIVNDGDYVAYEPVNLRNIVSMTVRLRQEAAGVIEMRLDAPDGPLLAAVALDSTTAAVPVPVIAQAQAVDAALAHDEALVVEGLDRTVYEGWSEITVPVTDPGGTHALFLIFRGEDAGPLAQLDWIEFNGPGMTRTGPGSSQE